MRREERGAAHPRQTQREEGIPLGLVEQPVVAMIAREQPLAAAQHEQRMHAASAGP